MLVEKVMLGLRKTSGLLLSDVPELDQETVCRLLSASSLIKESDYISIPAERLFISDSIIRSLLP